MKQEHKNPKYQFLRYFNFQFKSSWPNTKPQIEIYNSFQELCLGK